MVKSVPEEKLNSESRMEGIVNVLFKFVFLLFAFVDF